MNTDTLVEGQFGHGGVKDTPDIRDYKYSDIASASMPFDWNTGFDVESIIGLMPVKNQWQSFSCGGQAWSSYSYVLDQTSREEKSAKFIYAQTHVGSGGSDGRTNSNLCVNKGVSSEALCSSYKPDKTTDEPFMTNPHDITAMAFADATTNEEKSYLIVNTDIDTVAQAIRDEKGVVLGVTGQNNGTWLQSYPMPPQKNSPQEMWNHWVYAGKTRTINGKKYIGILNSWGYEVGENGWQYLSEDYFKSNYIWACWTMVYNAQVKFTFTKTLKFLSVGLDVKMLQTKLGLTADGIFGLKTLAAVKAYQTLHGLVADGVVGPKTNAVLNL